MNHWKETLEKRAPFEVSEGQIQNLLTPTRPRKLPTRTLPQRTAKQQAIQFIEICKEVDAEDEEQAVELLFQRAAGPIQQRIPEVLNPAQVAKRTESLRVRKSRSKQLTDPAFA